MVIPLRSDKKRYHKGRPLVLDKASYRRRNVVLLERPLSFDINHFSDLLSLTGGK